MEKSGYACPVCGKEDTLVPTGKTIVGWDGTDHRTFLKCMPAALTLNHFCCNWEGSLPTTYHRAVP